MRAIALSIPPWQHHQPATAPQARLAVAIAARSPQPPSPLPARSPPSSVSGITCAPPHGAMIRRNQSSSSPPGPAYSSPRTFLRRFPRLPVASSSGLCMMCWHPLTGSLYSRVTYCHSGLF